MRVEKRRGPNGIDYRIVGIVWGGTKPVDRLAIRFGNDQPFTPFAICPDAKDAHHVVAVGVPLEAGGARHLHIALEVPDQSIPQRRLKSGYYMRQVKIDEI